MLGRKVIRRLDQAGGVQEGHHGKDQGHLRRDHRQPQAGRAGFEKIAQIARGAGLPFVMDNTMRIDIVKTIDYGVYQLWRGHNR